MTCIHAVWFMLPYRPEFNMLHVELNCRWPLPDSQYYNVWGIMGFQAEALASLHWGEVCMIGSSLAGNLRSLCYSVYHSAQITIGS